MIHVGDVFLAGAVVDIGPSCGAVVVVRACCGRRQKIWTGHLARSPRCRRCFRIARGISASRAQELAVRRLAALVARQSDEPTESTIETLADFRRALSTGDQDGAYGQMRADLRGERV